MQSLKVFTQQWLNRFHLWRFLFFPTAAFALWLATLQGPYPVPSAPSDKVNHFLAFTVMTSLLRLGFPSCRPRLCALWMLAYGGLIEVIQSFLPWADCSIFDVMADAVGIGAAIALTGALVRWHFWRPAGGNHEAG